MFDSTGYPKYGYVIHKNDGTKKQFKIAIHRLVGITFYKKSNCEFDHIDCNKNNFTVQNLKSCTHSENVRNKKSLEKAQKNRRRKQRDLREIDINASENDIFAGYEETVGTLRFYTNVSYKNEIWKPIKGYEYIQAEASNFGRIRLYSKQYKSFIICSQNKHGNYYIVSIKNKFCYVHRLILLAFDSENENKYVDHINSNSKDNILSNLRWVSTHKENMNNANTIKKTITQKHDSNFLYLLYDCYTGDLIKTLYRKIEVLKFLSIKSFNYYIPLLSSERTIQKYLIIKQHKDELIQNKIQIQLA